MDIEELLLRKVAHPPRITRRWVLPCSRVVCLYRGYLGMHSHKINFPHHYSLQAIFASAFKAALLLHCTFGYNHKIGAWEIEFRTLQAWCSTSGPKAKFSTMTIIEFLQLSFLWRNPNTRARERLKKSILFQLHLMSNYTQHTCWYQCKNAGIRWLSQHVFRPAMDHAKVLFRFGSIVEFGKSPIGGKLVSGNLISLKAVVECPAEGSGKWKSSHSTHNLEEKKFSRETWVFTE